MNKRFFTIISGLLLITATQSCKKFTEVPSPKNEIILSDAFKTDASATSAVTGIYRKMMSNSYFENSNITLFSGMSADEITNYYAYDVYDQFNQNAVLAENSQLLAMWDQAYATLVQINTCIEGLNSTATLSGPLKSQLLGECYFSRAFEYFYLSNLWGDVPLALTSDWRINKVLARSPISDVNKQILQDLTRAKSLMQANYQAGTERSRPNKYTAGALLARFYLYQSDWKNAELEADSVINVHTYTLPAPAGAFLRTSTEAIWQLYPDRNIAFGQGLDEARDFIATSTSYPPYYPATSSLLNAFEPGDARKTSWMGSYTIGKGANSVTYGYPAKYKIVYLDASGNVEYYVVFRLAEQYLIRAEALAKQGRNAESTTDLNVIRKRARATATALPDIPATISNDDLLKAIAQERKVELFCEFGHRWFDLKRTGKANEVLAQLKPQWKSTAQLFPIPASERAADPNLTQNPGYNN